MGFPEGAQTTVLTMKLGLTDGSADRETVTITPSPSQIISTALDDIREGDPVTVAPDRSSGAAQLRLLNTDATGYNPSGWTYEVRRGGRAPYSISLPASLGPTVDLADLTEVSEAPGVYDVLLPARELGTAAFCNVGTAAGTVAAGDDDRFSGGGGGGPAPSATVAAGTSFGASSSPGAATAYSRGDHAHGTPAAPTLTGLGGLAKASNLSDVVNAPTARTNLGLGTAAVAAASAFDAAGAASAGLASAKSYADAGDTATLAAAKSYTDGHSGGGGSVRPVPYVDLIDAGIVILAAQADWTPVVGTNGVHVRRVIPDVNPGDVMQFSAEFLGIGTVYELDGRIPKGDGSGPARYLSSLDDGFGISGPEGYVPWYRQLSFSTVTGSSGILVTADQIAPDGTWTIEMVYRGTGITSTDSRLYFGNGYVGRWDVWHWPFGA